MPFALGNTHMALNTYRDKHNFAMTSEPPLTLAAQEKGQRQQSIFVVQAHQARRLHYDFRLEVEGVLKSWAIPKGPSLDPAQKRLAVEVQDHPLAYAKFVGTIPAGQYGAGTVTVWDHGTYDTMLADQPVPQTVTEGIAAGRLELTLYGSKLRGQFVLTRMHGQERRQQHWLLIKKQDPWAQPEKRARSQAQGRAEASPMTSLVHTSSHALSRSLARSRRVEEPPAPGVAYTHHGKLMYPETGMTKGAGLDFYQRIASRLLLYLYNRPATLERLPEGIHGADVPHFW